MSTIIFYFKRKDNLLIAFFFFFLPKLDGNGRKECLYKEFFIPLFLHLQTKNTLKGKKKKKKKEFSFPFLFFSSLLVPFFSLPSPSFPFHLKNKNKSLNFKSFVFCNFTQNINLRIY